MQPISLPKSLLELTATRIREAIIAGELPLGSKVSEQKLADQLGVSRSPVRDALALLQIEGLVSVQPKRGSFIFTPDQKMVEDLCEHRAVLEAACLANAMKRNYAELIEGMRGGIEEMNAAAANNDSAAYAIGDLRFHRTIVQNGGNRSIARGYTSTIGPLMAMRTHLFTKLHENLELAVTQHAALLEACERKDLAAAQKIITEHVRYLGEAFRMQQEEAPASSRKIA